MQWNKLNGALTMFGHPFLAPQVAEKQGGHNNDSSNDKSSHNSTNDVKNSEICNQNMKHVELL